MVIPIITELVSVRQEDCESQDGHPELRRKFKDRLGDIRKPCLKKETKSPKTNNAKLVTLGVYVRGRVLL